MMKQITIDVEENNFQTFLNFLNTLDYVNVLESKSKKVEIMVDQKISLAGALSEKSANLLVKHGQEIRSEWERDF